MTGEGEGKAFFFCFRSNFRVITRLETLAAQASKTEEIRLRWQAHVFARNFISDSPGRLVSFPRVIGTSFASTRIYTFFCCVPVTVIVKFLIFFLLATWIKRLNQLVQSSLWFLFQYKTLPFRPCKYHFLRQALFQHANPTKTHYEIIYKPRTYNRDFAVF